MWINRHPLANALAVFIHGFTGAAWKSWDTFPKLLQERNDPTTNSYDIYLFEYKSTWLSQPSIDTAIAELRQFLSQVRNKYDTIVLIAHSQGGVIAKLYVIEALLLGEGQRLKIDLVITCATPHLGIFLCNLPYVLRQLPLGRRLVRCNQLCDLASWGQKIRKLKQYWNRTLISSEPCAPTSSRRYIRSITFAYRENVVRQHNASGFYVDTPDLRGGERHGMTTTKLDLLFYEYLEQHGNPSKVLAAMGCAPNDEDVTEGFIQKYLLHVEETISAALPPGTKTDISALARVLIQAFLFEFPKRPLRCVTDVPDAVTRYARRKVTEVI